MPLLLAKPDPAFAERGSQVVSGLLGANEGRTVRRMAYDVDTVNTVYQLASHKVCGLRLRWPRPLQQGRFCFGFLRFCII